MKPVSQKNIKPTELIRLNKFIAKAGICSRRDADELITGGKVKVNGQTIITLGCKVNRTDTVEYNRKILRLESMRYILLNKPKGFITTVDDPFERRTVMSLVKNACEERIYPVGRLDNETTGLLLFTNDGEIAKKLTHPSHKVRKIYQVNLDKPLSKADFDSLLKGIELADGISKIDELAVLAGEGNNVGLEIHNGKNRIVRRLFESLGYQVQKLDRVMFASLTKKNLPRGNYRHLSPKELLAIKRIR